MRRLLIALLVLTILHTSLASFDSLDSIYSRTQQTCYGADPQQKQLLYDFYIATGGPNWTYYGGTINGIVWNFTSEDIIDADYCLWYGIRCATIEQLPGCDQIANIGFGYTNMQGTIPESVSNFTALRTFEISDNHGLKGKLPFNLFSKMDHLYVVTLNNNSLIGDLLSFSKLSFAEA